MKNNLSILIAFLCVLFIFISCKKDNPEILIDFTEESVEFNLEKSYIFESGLNGFQYAYGSITLIGQNNLLITAVRYPKILSDYKEKADIVSIVSSDNGKTWGESVVIQSNLGIKNTSHPSIVKLNEKELFMTFSAINSSSNVDLYYKQSFDNGKTWTNPSGINGSGFGYHVAVNDRLVFKKGKIFLPSAYVNGDIFENYEKQEIILFTSDNLGKTWNQRHILKENHSLMEPNLVFLNSEEALINMRTKLGYVYFARSLDGGFSWNLEKSNIPSPASPQKIIQVPGENILVMIWNNNRVNFRSSFNNRSPLSIAISKNKGYNWSYIGDIENSKEFDYSYPSVTFTKENMYVLYYEREKITNNKASLKLAKISLKSILN